MINKQLDKIVEALLYLGKEIARVKRDVLEKENAELPTDITIVGQSLKELEAVQIEKISDILGIKDPYKDIDL